MSGTQNDPAWVRNDGDDDLSQHMMSVLPFVTTHYLQPTLVIFVSLGVVCLPACLLDSFIIGLIPAFQQLIDDEIRKVLADRCHTA